MKAQSRPEFFWPPRALLILFALFISMFALDVIGTGRNIGETLLGLIVHLMPVWLILAALLLSWRRPLFGAGLFLFLALAAAGFYDGLMGSIIVLVFLIASLLFVLDHHNPAR